MDSNTAIWTLVEICVLKVHSNQNIISCKRAEKNTVKPHYCMPAESAIPYVL